MKRNPEGDRPALVATHYTLNQIVGFLDGNGVPCEYTLELAIEKGYIREGEVRTQRVSLQDYADRTVASLMERGQRLGSIWVPPASGEVFPLPVFVNTKGRSGGIVPESQRQSGKRARLLRRQNGGAVGS